MKLSRETRLNVVLEAALDVALRDGIVALTFEKIAQACQVETSAATVRRYGGRIIDLQRLVLERAAVAASKAKYERMREDAVRFRLISEDVA